MMEDVIKDHPSLFEPHGLKFFSHLLQAEESPSVRCSLEDH